MFPEESSEEHADSFYQDGSYDDSDDNNSGKGCLIPKGYAIIMAVILMPAGYFAAPALPAVNSLLSADLRNVKDELGSRVPKGNADVGIGFVKRNGN